MRSPRSSGCRYWEPERRSTTWHVGLEDLQIATQEQWSRRTSPSLSESLTHHRIRSLRQRRTSSRPGCIVIARIHVDSADDHQAHDWITRRLRQRNWRRGPNGPMSEMIAAHFDASNYGTHMVNLVEWSDAEAHHRMMADAASAAAAEQPDPAEVRTDRR